ncbi:MAG TPA: thioredoxin domain-containing protein [Gemmatimonadaceae bacterium]|nr:thioredoxin domain-containing protein [Gemmatimonadaceae bacterium]
MNHLARSTSPYLLQHADNPVDWHPWGPDALARARADDKPILLSIGYAACHWCHVMAHESFEDPAIAALMNERFVNIKVDREERPDLDAIYMTAVQAMTGQGGWPMTVFLTPGGVPFYGGTYFPPADRHGMPGFPRVLRSVSDAWRERRGDVESTTARVRELYAHAADAAAATGPLTTATLDRAWTGIAERYDERHGGFLGAPKFPPTMALDAALRRWARTGDAHARAIAHRSFAAMARGGIYDQLGGGLHRYAVDDVWLVPHFEKMLYDNALLARLGVHLFQATGDALPRRIAEETIDWAAREMLSPEGGFYSSLDADSEGHEGKFYVWSAGEFDALAGAAAPEMRAYWGVTAAGNFEGANILHVTREGEPPDALPAVRAALLAVRDKRVRPARDEKVLTAWNGLMLRAIADAARILGRADYAALALRNAEFLWMHLVRDGRAMRVRTAGVTAIGGFLDDQAALALALLAVYELTLDPSWLDRARLLAARMDEWFWDEGARAYFDTARDAEALITRPREVTDNAVPAGTSLAVELLLRLAEFDMDDARRARAAWVLETLAEPMARFGPAFGHLIGAAELAIDGAVEIAIAGDPRREDARALIDEVALHYLPNAVLAAGDAGAAARIRLLAGRAMTGGRATAYVCRRFVCDAPVTSRAELGAQLSRESPAR